MGESRHNPDQLLKEIQAGEENRNKGLLKIFYHCNGDFFYVFLRKDHRHGSFASTNHFSSSLYRKLSCPPIMTV